MDGSGELLALNNASAPEQVEGAQGVADDLAAKKLQRLRKEKRDLVDSLASGDFSTQRARVAYILNLYPAARNSDVTLALKYWEEFQPAFFNPEGIKPEHLFELEHVPLLVRARAKIQNEYELFQADVKVRRRRRGREDEIRDAVLGDAAPRQTLQVFADETGKTEAHVIVGAVWVLNGRAVFDVSQAINSWKAQSTFAKREVHFARFGKGDIGAVAEYLGVISANREFLSFKFIAVRRENLKRSIEDTVQRLHEFMLLKGLEHEVDTGRVGLPRFVTLTLDEEQSLDQIAIEVMKQRMSDGLQNRHGDGLVLESVVAVSSKNSALVQLADVIAGSVNRRLNFSGTRNHKDDIADLVIERLGIGLNRDEVDADLDATVMFRI
ncbi:hypothetical protein AWB76_06011 [Caballeronia temeraria]|uniref:DUF3800 domain-containing protein n=1 Tax=Caballeronia temeraria TaxID=1777137 RepID=A0A158CV59_9BURK|nr:DUF3800 domain-containing protein [Caballeronia temeraria]SAK86090.1 hypothetical protein AWB76_06011 [Caballeronia temeraria]